jgi:hypothetical protein
MQRLSPTLKWIIDNTTRFCSLQVISLNTCYFKRVNPHRTIRKNENTFSNQKLKIALTTENQQVPYSSSFEIII